MASAGTTATALLFSFSTILLLLLLLQAPAPPPGLLGSALDRFLLQAQAPAADLLVSALDRLLDVDGRGVLEVVATRTNMILLCHAILLLILMDAGILGAPARRRSPPAPGEATVAAAGTVEIAWSAVSAARPHATRSAVVWRRRRPRNRAVVTTHDAASAATARRLVEYHQPAAAEEEATTWAAPVLTTGPPAQVAEEAAAVATKQMVIVESPRNDDLLDGRHDRAAVVEPLEHPTATAADDGERDHCDDRRVIIATAREQQTAGMEMEMEMEIMELADDRTFEEFIQSQRRHMRQESLQQLVSSASAGYHYQYQAIAAACY